MAKRNRRAKVATSSNPAPSRVAATDEQLQATLGRRASGAAGIHADQNARRHAVGATNRIGSRSARRRAAINDQ